MRNWANEYDTLYVVTGPLLSSNLPKIGPNGVSVPAFYYKAVLRYGSAGNQGIAFMLPNNSSNAHLQTFAISIDSLERVSGINFFHQLPDDVETVIERQMCISCWNWQAQKLSNEKPASSGASTQCLGTTKAGNRCKSRTTHASGFCHAHLNQFQGSSTITQELQRTRSSLEGF